MSITNLDGTDNAMASHFSISRVSFIEARELSWRGFYEETGGKEPTVATGGSGGVRKSLKKCEKVFLDILENTIAEDELKRLINLPPTDTWVEDYNNQDIILRTKEVLSLSNVEAKIKRSEGMAINFKRYYGGV